MFYRVRSEKKYFERATVFVQTLCMCVRFMEHGRNGSGVKVCEHILQSVKPGF